MHGGGVATPRRTAFVEPTVRGELRHALEPLRAQDGNAVDSWPDVERHIAVDRDGKDETAGVIRVIAHEVDATRGAEGAGAEGRTHAGGLSTSDEHHFDPRRLD